MALQTSQDYGIIVQAMDEMMSAPHPILSMFAGACLHCQERFVNGDHVLRHKGHPIVCGACFHDRCFATFVEQNHPSSKCPLCNEVISTPDPIATKALCDAAFDFHQVTMATLEGVAPAMDSILTRWTRHWNQMNHMLTWFCDDLGIDSRTHEADIQRLFKQYHQKWNDHHALQEEELLERIGEEAPEAYKQVVNSIMDDYQLDMTLKDRSSVREIIETKIGKLMDPEMIEPIYPTLLVNSYNDTRRLEPDVTDEAKYVFWKIFTTETSLVLPMEY